VTRKILAAAKKGDMQACRLILERLVPPVKATAEAVSFYLDDHPLKIIFSPGSKAWQAAK